KSRSSSLWRSCFAPSGNSSNPTDKGVTRMNLVKTKGKALPLGIFALLASVFAPSAFAAVGGVDVSATVAAIGDALGPIGQIGIAVLGVLVAIKVYKWVRRAM